jgi:heme O synthase-like polyprenyltransferase
MVDAVASIGDIIKYAAMVAVGVALLIAAVMFVASAGNPNRVETARKIFYYSFIGIMIATLAHFLPGVVRFFLGI